MMTTAWLEWMASLTSTASMAPIALLAPLSLIVSAIKVALIVAIALAATSRARHRSAALRHWLLSAGLACAMAMPLLQPVVPTWGVLLIAPSQLISAASGRVDDGDGVGARVDDPRRDSMSVTQRLSRRLSMQAATDADADAEADAAARRLDGRDGLTFALTALMALWAIGAIACASIVLVGFARLMWLAAHAHRVLHGRGIDMTRDIARELGVRRPIRLLHSMHPSLLATWGVWRPTLLLPASAMAWSEERMRIVLCHEIAHIRRNDWAIQLCADLLRCLYWFNPLLWMACTRLRHESEIACDDEVLGRGVERTTYATHVLDLARAYGQHRRAAAAGAAMAHPSGLERRIRVMLNARLDRAPITRSVHIATIIAVALIAPPVAGFGAVVLGAQAPASLSGTIVDPSGAAVPYAEVLLTNATGDNRAADVDANGRFTYAGLTPGEYVIEVRAEGFAPVEDRVTLSPDQRIERRVRLPIGSVEETLVIAGLKSSAKSEPKELPERARVELATARTNNRQPVLVPERVRVMQPVYPEDLQRAGVHGTVTLMTRITTDGRVTIDKVLSPSSPELAAAARDAVREWRYDPTRLHGMPIETPMLVTIDFVP
jgi:TonB family protein